MNSKGFTLIEAMIIIAILGILASILLPYFSKGEVPSFKHISFNGYVESRCIDGYKYTIDSRGNSHQTMNEFGKGVRCENE